MSNNEAREIDKAYQVSIEELYRFAKEKNEVYFDMVHKSIEIRMEERARTEHLLIALNSIANSTCCDTCKEAALVAQAAIAKWNAKRSNPERPNGEELSKGTYACPECGLETPHSGEAHGATVLPEIIYGVPSFTKDHLVWLGSSQSKAFARANLARDVIEYRRSKPGADHE